MKETDGRVVNSSRRKFLFLVNKYGLNRVLNIVDSFDENDKRIFSLYYGLNDRYYSMEEIASILNVSLKSISFLVKKKLDDIENVLKISKEASYDKSKEISEMFSGYSMEVVELAISKLKDIDRDIICHYYGLNGYSLLSQKEIAEKISVSINVVSIHLRGALKDVKNILDDPNYIYSNNDKFKFMYSSYSKEDFEFAFLSLTKRNRLIFSMYYGINGEKELTMKEIGEKLRITIGNVNQCIDFSNKKIHSILENKSDKIKEFISLFSQEDIEKAKMGLKDEIKNIFELALICKDEKKVLKQISLQYNVEIKGAKIMLNRLLSEVEHIIIVSKSADKNRDIFYKMYSSYEKERVLEAVSKLKDRDREIVIRYYGLDGGKAYSYRKIAPIVNLSVARVEKVLKSSLKTITTLLENPDQVKKIDKFDNFSVDFFGYDKENFVNLLIKFDDESREIISRYYGLNGYEVTSKKDLVEKYGFSNVTINNSMKKDVVRIKDILDGVNLDESQEKLLELLECYGVSDFERVVKNLDGYEIRLLSLYYGLYGCKEFSVKELAKKMRVSEIEAREIINNTNLKLADCLEKKVKMNNVINRKLMFRKKIKTENLDAAIRAMDFLSSQEAKIIFLYYGLDGKTLLSNKEISELFQVNEDEVEAIVENAIDNFKNILLENNFIKK